MGGFVFLGGWGILCRERTAVILQWTR